MSQQPGLRFDIYERIVLPEDAVSIRELDGVELIPHIQVEVEGEQAVVRGHLALEGIYASEDEMRSPEALHHLIPVEITLPMNRVSSVEEIAVQIDNFDVDLLSSRSLNVTGVLSLHGIEMQSAATDGWREEEEVVFVHNAEGGPSEAGEEEEYVPSATAPWFQEPAAVYQPRNEYAPIAASVPPEQETHEFEQQDAEAVTETETETESEEPQVFQPDYQLEERSGAYALSAFETAYPNEQATREEEAYVSAAPPAVYQPYSHPTEEVQAGIAPKPREEILEDTFEDITLLDNYDTYAADEDASSGAWGGAGSLNGAYSSNNSSSPGNMGADEEDDRDKEMKIAFASKKSSDSQSDDFKNYIHKNEAPRRADADREAAQAMETRGAVQEVSLNDTLEWKRLFLSGSEEQKFKKLRMVIVQKEETIESIARRYDRKPQELKLYNRLQELDISVGQVIYIP